MISFLVFTNRHDSITGIICHNIISETTYSCMALVLLLLYCMYDWIPTWCTPSPNSVVKEYCQVMFDYSAYTEDEMDLKKGDIVTVVTKVWDIVTSRFLVLAPRYTVALRHLHFTVLNMMSQCLLISLGVFLWLQNHDDVSLCLELCVQKSTSWPHSPSALSCNKSQYTMISLSM